MNTDLNVVISSTLRDCHSLWERLGVDYPTQVKRTRRLFENLEQACKDYLEDARDEVARAETQIATKKREIDEICESLGIVHKPFEDEGASLLEADRILSLMANSIAKQRDEQREIVSTLLVRLALVKEQLGDVSEYKDLASPDDLRKTHVDKLKAVVESLEDTRSRRMNQVVILLPQIEDLCTLLGEPLPKVVASGGRDETGEITCRGDVVEELKRLFRELKNLQEERKQVMDSYRSQIDHLCQDLRLKEDKKRSLMVQLDGLSKVHVGKGQDIVRDLKEKRYNELIRQVMETETQIAQLWERHGVSEAKRKFPECAGQLGAALSQKNIPPDARDAVELLAERTLKECGEILRKLQERDRALTPILMMIEKRKEQRARQEELKALQKDGSWLKRPDFTEILKESTKIGKTLPLLEKKILTAINNWNAQHPDKDEQFTYNGKDFIEMMKEEEEKEEEERKIKQIQRRAARERAELNQVLRHYPPQKAHERSTPVPLEATPLATETSSTQRSETKGFMAATDSSLLRKQETKREFPVIAPRFKSPANLALNLTSGTVPITSQPRQSHGDNDDFLESYNALVNAPKEKSPRKV